MAFPFQGDLSDGINMGDHRRGSLMARARIVVYFDVTSSDFVAMYEQLAKLIESFGEDVLVAYRYLPDTASNPIAYAAAQALEAAAQQDHFHEMLAQLVTHKGELTDGILRQHARAIDIDKAQFEDDFSSAATRKRIENDVKSAKASGVESAPGVFINGIRQKTLSARYIHELIDKQG